MKTRVIGVFTICITILVSCNKGLDGKIEKRGNGKIYLINTSENNAFKFTVKTTSVTNDSIMNYKTDIVELAPGDEKYIGNAIEASCATPPLPDGYQIVVDTTLATPLVDDLPDLNKPTLTKYTYKVTGQLQIKTLTPPPVKKRR